MVRIFIINRATDMLKCLLPYWEVHNFLSVAPYLLLYYSGLHEKSKRHHSQVYYIFTNIKLNF